MEGAERPYVLSIAGFDPSAGAGVLADVKTIEAAGCYGLGVVSALTVQNDISFDSVEWVRLEMIEAQVTTLLRRFPVRFVKIGLVENSLVLKQLVALLKQLVPDVTIVFDPVLKASAGFDFHSGSAWGTDVFDGIFCITPNIPEAELLFGVEGLNERLEEASERVNIYLKGGHSDLQTVTDLLYTADHTYAFANDRIANGAKHGSGCVLSSMLTAQLAAGYTLPDAAERANAYMQHYLASTETLLGYHKQGVL